MNPKTVALCMLLAAAVSFSLVTQASLARAASPNPGGQCIPCSINHPCENPLTICTYKGGSNHGCCLGYAG